jgi:hypothetical protein
MIVDKTLEVVMSRVPSRHTYIPKRNARVLDIKQDKPFRLALRHYQPARQTLASARNRVASCMTDPPQPAPTRLYTATARPTDPAATSRPWNLRGHWTPSPRLESVHATPRNSESYEGRKVRSWRLSTTCPRRRRAHLHPVLHSTGGPANRPPSPPVFSPAGCLSVSIGSPA